MTNASTGSTEADLKTLRDDMAQLRDDLGEIGGTLQKLLRNGKKEAVGKLTDAGDMVRDEVKKRVNSVTDEIEDKPVAAALLSFGLGIILGMLFAGRRS
jgi:ElaB/YqjD/DUF883 family membrane-anchored ribosome-binding protein